MAAELLWADEDKLDVGQHKESLIYPYMNMGVIYKWKNFRPSLICEVESIIFWILLTSQQSH